MGAVLELPAKQFAANPAHLPRKWTKGENWQCNLASSSKTAPRIFILSIVRIFILCEIHCYFCPHILWVYYFRLSQCVWYYISAKSKANPAEYKFCTYQRFRDLEPPSINPTLIAQLINLEKLTLIKWTFGNLLFIFYFFFAQCTTVLYAYFLPREKYVLQFHHHLSL